MSTDQVIECKVNEKNQIWFKEDNGNVLIGFTDSFLDIVNSCWHVTPSNKENLQADNPLMTIETNEALFTVSSPVEGRIVSFNEIAQNFPDQLKTDDVICVIGPKTEFQQVEDAFDRLMQGGTPGSIVGASRQTVPEPSWTVYVDEAATITQPDQQRTMQQLREFAETVAVQQQPRIWETSI
jgi:glycine cleavage system H lipoate-binding protein